MDTLYCHPAHRLPDELRYAMFEFRRRVFHEELRWEVPVKGGMEFDEYDALNPIYLISTHDGQVDGCMRMLPTQRPYMLKDTFPQLVPDGNFPCHPRIWEISRFAVSAASGQANLNYTTGKILWKALSFCVDQGIEECVFVSSAALVRLLRPTGFSATVVSGPIMIGDVSTVYARVPTNEQTLERVTRFLKRYSPS